MSFFALCACVCMFDCLCVCACVPVYVCPFVRVYARARFVCSYTELLHVSLPPPMPLPFG